MSEVVLLPGLIGYILTGLTIVHALMDAKKNRIQRILILPTIFVFAAFLEVMGVITGLFSYATELIMILDRVPLSITLSWVGIIYSSMIITERLKLSLWQRILTTSLIALCLDWGMDPIAVESGAWSFGGGEYFNVPAVNFFGWLFIPLAYLIPYGLTWDKVSKKLKILNITEVDLRNSPIRKLYTVFFVVPFGLGILMLLGFFTRIPLFYNLNSVILVIWAIFTIVWACGIVFWKKKTLKKTNWFDLIPPISLLIISYYYVISSFIIGQVMLGLLMLIAALPYLLVFVFSLRKNRFIEESI
ncbi:MAG: carotenoid biosynthesis protein [Candidatus Lokiarchaeota archaeon]|nr:carotenoid biosynthesis protein [Candidatus Lokiarchaeota archaeon]